jgi:hypothetical protein
MQTRHAASVRIQWLCTFVSVRRWETNRIEAAVMKFRRLEDAISISTVARDGRRFWAALSEWRHLLNRSLFDETTTAFPYWVELLVCFTNILYRHIYIYIMYYIKQSIMNINKSDNTRHEPSTCWILGHNDVAWLSETSPSFKLQEMARSCSPFRSSGHRGLSLLFRSSEWNASAVEANCPGLSKRGLLKWHIRVSVGGNCMQLIT